MGKSRDHGSGRSGRAGREAGARPSPTTVHPESTLRFTQFAVDNLSDAAYWVGEDARITYVNDAACRLTGYSRDELLDMHIYDLNVEIPRESWPEVWATLKRARKRTFETRHRAKDGRVFPVEISANFLEFQGQEYSCAFARDISERRRMELRLRQAEKMEAIGHLAGRISHDFNNLLMGIMGYADLLRRRLAAQPELAELADHIVRSARHAGGLTAQLLAFSRKDMQVSEPVDVHRLVADVIDQISHDLDREISIVRRLEAGVPFTAGDPAQLQSAALNVALNARDAMPDGGTLTFATRNVHIEESFGPDHLFPAAPGDYVRLTISDTGRGMDAATRRRIFEPFFTTKPTGKGTGLGLAAVYGTVKSHNGTVNVCSEPGSGTRVELYLPATHAAPVMVASPEPAPHSRLRSKHVVLVEDEAELRKVTRGLLEELGCRVTTFESGEEALRHYETAFDSVDVVILDMVMPVMNGRGTFRAMREINPYVRVLLASGYGFEQDAREILGEGARGFLQKPFDGASLARKLLEVLLVEG